MVYVFDMGGVLVDIDVQGFLRRLTALMPSGSTLGATPDELLGGGGDSFLHDYEMGYIGTGEALRHFRSLCRPEVTDKEIRAVWYSEISLVPEKTKALLRRLRREGNIVFLLSNTNPMHWEEYVLPDLCKGGYAISNYFNRVFLSYELHLFKPQPEMYAEIEKYIPVGDKVIYIDDVESNRLAAPAGWITFASIDCCAI